LSSEALAEEDYSFFIEPATFPIRQLADRDALIPKIFSATGGSGFSRILEKHANQRFVVFRDHLSYLALYPPNPPNGGEGGLSAVVLKKADVLRVQI